MSIIKDQASSALDQYIKEVRNRCVHLPGPRAKPSPKPARTPSLPSTLVSSPHLDNRPLTSMPDRNFAEDQRKRAARQVRDLVNIAKQGEQVVATSLPCASC